MEKDRIIVDARESLINEKQTVPERAVLPRGVDVALDARCLAQGHAAGRSTFDADEMDPCPAKRGAHDAADSDMEIIGGDIVDAYPHLPIHPDELGACLSYSEDEGPSATLLLWVCLFFGLRSAPLIWCRFAAALMQLLQSVFDHHRARGIVQGGLCQSIS